jgi:hypothetical protein
LSFSRISPAFITVPLSAASVLIFSTILGQPL